MGYRKGAAWGLLLQWILVAVAAAEPPQQTGRHTTQHQHPQHGAHSSAAASAGTVGQQQSVHLHGLPGRPDPAVEALVAYLRAQGAEVNYAVRVLPGSGRVAVAATDVQQGDVLARLPLRLAYELSSASKQPSAGCSLLLEMVQRHSPWSLYFKALPAPSEVWTAVRLPPSYLPILQDSSTAQVVEALQAQAEEEWQRRSKVLQFLEPTLGFSNLTYAMSLAQSRSFKLGVQSYMLPLLDMPNHHTSCKHTIGPEPCPTTPHEPSATAHDAHGAPACFGSQCGAVEAAAAAAGPAAGRGASSSARCVVWRAGEAVPAGRELCYGYRDILLQDVALLDYGFLQDGPVAQELSLMDRHERSPADLDLWGAQSKVAKHSSLTGLPSKFMGEPQEVEQELQRLTDRLAQLTAGGQMVAAIQSDPTADPEGRMLAVMLQWRQQRLQAIEAELQRLRGLLPAAGQQDAGGLATA